MPLNPYHDFINILKVLELQERQYQSIIPLEVEVPPGEQIDASVNISPLGHFMMLTITGSFTTLDNEGQDNSVNHLFVQMVDGSNSRQLFEDFVPANLFLSPGRVKSAGVAGDPPEPLFMEYPFIYTFKSNGQIIVKVRNDDPSDTNTISFAFKGIRIFTQARDRA